MEEKRLFRLLRADEIECRVQTITENGLVLVLYKDARCDMNILDEAVGAYNWKKSYSRENANCTVSLYDESKGEWVSKEDTGTESNIEKEKGLASNSFKRASTCWGIGRELYTAPFIWINSNKVKISSGRNGKLACYEKFHVKNIEYDDRYRIKKLTIVNDSGQVVYMFGGSSKKAETSVKKGSASAAGGADPERDMLSKITDAERDELMKLFTAEKIRVEYVNSLYSMDKLTDATYAKYLNIKKNIERIKKKQDEEEKK